MTENAEATHSGALGWLIRALFALGVVSRVAPLFHQGERVFWQWPTEDGYLMMGIARHIALGNGFATADGSIPTNGTQPLTTLIEAGVFWLVGGDRFWGVFGTQVLLLVSALVAAWALARFAEQVLTGHAHAKDIAWLLAGVWFASSVFVRHSMNCLETGPYALVVILVAWTFVESNAEAKAGWSMRRCLAVGGLLGLAFWTRNDAVFLILAACLTYVWSGWRAGGLPLAKAHFLRTLIFGATSVLVAVPWLAFNYLEFGHIMPVSGRAESETAELADNFILVGPQLLEYAVALLPIPRAIEAQPAFIAASFLAVVAYGVAVARLIWPRASETARRAIVLGAIYILGICGFYGLFFGAGWFIPRYFYPFTPLLMLVWGPAVWELARRVPAPNLWRAAGALTIVLVLATSIREYRLGSDHQHDQVVAWVKENVPEDVWVAAVQTGTLNFFHDRTLNLDGKVNPAAYQALIQGVQAHQRYLVQETRVKYMVDWHDAVQDWTASPELKGHFEIVYADPEANVAAARRTAEEDER